jgi:hypothetical protein
LYNTLILTNREQIMNHPEIDNPETDKAICWNIAPGNDVINVCRTAAVYMNTNGNGIISYESSIIGAATAFEMLTDESSSNQGILIGDLQSGKTSTMLTLAHALPRLISDRYNIPLSQVRVGVLIITNISQTTLYNQTKQRILESGFKLRPISHERSDINNEWFVSNRNMDEHGFVSVKPVMLSGGATDKLLNTTVDFKNNGITHTFILLDEAQQAMNTGQQFATFLEKQGWVLSRTSNEYEPPLYILGVTATPLSKFVLPPANLGRLYYSYIAPGNNYYGLHEIIQTRLHYIDKEDINIESMYDIVSKLPKFGYLVIRMPKKFTKVEEIFTILSDNNDWYKPQHYSASAGNISRLNDKLATKIDKRQVIFIKDAAGAGDTFDNVENIIVWIDLRFNNPESTTQSIGRLCGYAIDRISATFPIYTHNHQEVIKWHDALQQCKNGTDVDILREAVGLQSSINIILQNPETGERINKLTPDCLVIGTYEEYLAQIDTLTKNFELGNKFTQRVHVSRNKVVDVSGSLLGVSHANDSRISVRDKYSFFDCSEEPTNQIFLENYKNLISMRPELQTPGLGAWVKLELFAKVEQQRKLPGGTVLSNS